MFYIIGDTHGSIDINKLNTANFSEQKLLTKNDYVVICGDFGLVWNLDKEDQWWLKWLQKKPFTTLFIDGNHEGHELLDSFPINEWNGGKVHFINDSVIHLLRGQVFTIDNKKIFTFGGAESVDKEHRKIGLDWWAREMPSYREYEEGFNNLDKHNWLVDYIFTHTCSSHILYEISKKTHHSIDRINDLNEYFNVLEEKLQFKHWFFGHYHLDLAIDDRHTVVYNKFIKL